MHFITIFIVRNPVIFLISFAVHPLSAIIFLCKGTVPELGSSTASLLLQNWNGILPQIRDLGIPSQFGLSSLPTHSFRPVRNALKTNPDRGAKKDFE